MFCDASTTDAACCTHTSINRHLSQQGVSNDSHRSKAEAGSYSRAQLLSTSSAPDRFLRTTLMTTLTHQLLRSAYASRGPPDGRAVLNSSHLPTSLALLCFCPHSMEYLATYICVEILFLPTTAKHRLLWSWRRNIPAAVTLQRPSPALPESPRANRHPRTADLIWAYWVGLQN
jgi:hypothetical protein